jgi:hypothetical protein
MVKSDADDSTSPCQFRRKASKLGIQVGPASKTNDDQQTTLLLVVTARISCRRRKGCRQVTDQKPIKPVPYYADKIILVIECINENKIRVWPMPVAMRSKAWVSNLFRVNGVTAGWLAGRQSTNFSKFQAQIYMIYKHGRRLWVRDPWSKA